MLLSCYWRFWFYIVWIVWSWFNNNSFWGPSIRFWGWWGRFYLIYFRQFNLLHLWFTLLSILINLWFTLLIRVFNAIFHYISKLIDKCILINLSLALLIFVFYTILQYIINIIDSYIYFLWFNLCWLLFGKNTV